MIVFRPGRSEGTGRIPCKVLDDVRDCGGRALADLLHLADEAHPK